MSSLLGEPFDNAGYVVTVGYVVTKRRETVGLASLLHLRKLFEVEFLVLHRAPIVFRVVHREARSNRTIRADNQPVLAGAATPVFSHSAHEALHILQAR